MTDTYKKIDFQNSQDPSSRFDLLSLQQMMTREFIDHSPFRLHQVDFFAILFIQDGQGLHTIDFVDYKCKKGSLLVIRKDQIQKFHRSEMEGVLMVFTLEFLGRFYAKSEAQKSLLLFNEFLSSPLLQLSDEDYTPISQLINRMNAEYIDISDGHSQSIIRSEMQILISKLYRNKTETLELYTHKKYIAEFISFHNCIEERFTESLKVKDYAQWLGINTKTLNTVTQHIIKKSAKEFIDEICLNHIKRQLINSEKSIKEICFETGFEEPSNFYNYFKKRVELTPEEYRRANH